MAVPEVPKYADALMHLPAQSAVAITPSDASNLARESRGIWVGGAGDLKVDMVGTGTGVTFVGIPAGSLLPLRVSKIYATGTTATDIVEVY